MPPSTEEVTESFRAFGAYLATYSIDVAELAPDLRVEIDGDNAAVIGLPEIDGVPTLDLSKRKLTKRLPLPIGLVCEVLLCGGTLVSGIDHLPEGLRKLEISDNRRFKRWPTSLPDSIESLDVSKTSLTEVGRCPSGLRVLNCDLSEIASIAELPSSLTELRCRANHLTELPELPNDLEVLVIRSNPIAELPSLPAGLRELDWRTALDVPVPILPQSLTNLSWKHSGPTEGSVKLPASLRTLSITLDEPIALPSGLRSLSLELDHGVTITALPPSIEDLWYRGESPLPAPLPSALKNLHCGRNDLVELPPLPPGLTSLSCTNNQLIELPPLPDGLESLWCTDNLLTRLPELPDSIVELNCENNHLTELPQLPASLRHLWCNDNNMTTLPRLDRWWDHVDTAGGYDIDQGLRVIECHRNQLTAIPALPKGLDVLRCQHNEISEMPAVPIGTSILNCSHNRLTELTELPAKLRELYCNDNRELAVIDTYRSEPFDRLHKSNATRTALNEATKERLRSWRVRVD